MKANSISLKFFILLQKCENLCEQRIFSLLFFFEGDKSVLFECFLIKKRTFGSKINFFQKLLKKGLTFSAIYDTISVNFNFFTGGEFYGR